MQIKEFSEKTGLTPYTIRFYEKKELFRVKRDEKNRRIYDETDIEWIKMIKRLKTWEWNWVKLRDIQICDMKGTER